MRQSLLINVRGGGGRIAARVSRAAAEGRVQGCRTAYRALAAALSPLPGSMPPSSSRLLPPPQHGNAKYEQSILRAAGGLEWKGLVEEAAAKFREAGERLGGGLIWGGWGGAPLAAESACRVPTLAGRSSRRLD